MSTDQVVEEVSKEGLNDERVQFGRDEGVVKRTIEIDGRVVEGKMNVKGISSPYDESDWFVGWLQGRQRQWKATPERRLGVVDLFSGAGGFSLGFAEAAAALGFKAEFLAAADMDAAALQVHGRNFGTRHLLTENIFELVDYQVWADADGLSFADEPEALKQLARLKGKVDVVIGGPPCQGHSNLNNHTRRNDGRNILYLTVPAIATALGAEIVIIENVQSVLKDEGNVVEKAVSLMRNEGYHVIDSEGVTLRAEDFGVAQLRRRHFLVGSKRGNVNLTEVSQVLKSHPPTVMQAIGDLEQFEGSSEFDRAAVLSEENQRRIEYLFENDLYDLPNEERPDCHKNGHTYPAVYGRMKGNHQSNTITTGFLSPGRGRYIHPHARRGLTSHEAARLQGFPDDFEFLDSEANPLSNKAYSKMIGDAVPPPLGFVPSLAALLTL